MDDSLQELTAETECISGTPLKDKIISLLDILPEPRLVAVFDFVRSLIESEVQAAWVNAQSHSVAYQEWLSKDNDIYDELLADDCPTR
jgi:hypothetical protein